MNATNVNNIRERSFQVELFREVRTVQATGWRFKDTDPEPTRWHARGVIAIRYRTGKFLHRGDIEFETAPEQVERLSKAPFNWKKGDGYAYRVTGSRNFGNFRSALIPIGWADKYPQERFA